MATILSVSIPAGLRRSLDTEAKRLHRSRSFVVCEAIRSYLARQDRDAFTSARDRTLLESLALAPSERVRLAEQLWEELAGHRTPRTPWTASFDSYDQYQQSGPQGGGRAA